MSPTSEARVRRLADLRTDIAAAGLPDDSGLGFEIRVELARSRGVPDEAAQVAAVLRSMVQRLKSDRPRPTRRWPDDTFEDGERFVECFKSYWTERRVIEDDGPDDNAAFRDATLVDRALDWTPRALDEQQDSSCRDPP